MKFSEESMAKARIALNDLVEKAWVELDDRIIACKEYQVMNRATLDQVVTDIASLVEQIIDLERIETESMEGIAKMEAEIKAVEEELESRCWAFFHHSNDMMSQIDHTTIDTSIRRLNNIHEDLKWFQNYVQGKYHKKQSNKGFKLAYQKLFKRIQLIRAELQEKRLQNRLESIFGHTFVKRFEQLIR